MTIVANTFAYVIGADTHSRTHTLAVIDVRTGARVDTSTFPTTPAGLSRAVAWIASRTGGLVDVLVAIEGVGSYGARLARACQDAGYRVVESFPTPARQRRGLGKSDEIDAELIARSVLSVDADKLRDPRQDAGIRAALRVLVAGRELLNSDRTRSINALTALLRTVDLGIDARRPLTKAQLVTIASWRHRQEDLAAVTARREAIRLARRITACDQDLADNRHEITALVRASDASGLLEQPGIGAINAAAIIVAWSHPGRVRSEAAFAVLAGVSPVPASSGNTTRHRLNRGGDRRLNRALSSIALTRMSHHPATRAYVERRRAQGRTTKEIRRSLKRYIARQLYRHLTTQNGLDRT
ncbi:IS110 family transposase [Microbacterium limosum]|uniref:IS110 family transposase n=1 Tax=Microbacterium limosum TaxID=3079935 RepID=A0AAU0MJC7_9MICO|nr:IS110 family transposase [Microbacterium sp. Y20]WOQ68721.1 IS110 family transposase [Microbacterium sp. Y20]WOQ70629.1 IS110 family transposase [Microbacterium sp. Y20]